MARVVDHLIALTIPLSDRESVLGDLHEEELGVGFARMRSLLGIAAYFHAEPYRDEDARVRSLSIFVAALSILWAVPVAAGSTPPNPELFSGPILSVMALFWTASYLPASAAAGLLVGHAPWLPDWAGHVRVHAAVVLAGFGWTLAGTPMAGVAAVSSLLAAAWFGDRARRAGPPTRPSAG